MNKNYKSNCDLHDFNSCLYLGIQPKEKNVLTSYSTK